jgi:hypothetical protein
VHNLQALGAETLVVLPRMPCGALWVDLRVPAQGIASNLAIAALAASATVPKPSKSILDSLIIMEQQAQFWERFFRPQCLKCINRKNAHIWILVGEH